MFMHGQLLEFLWRQQSKQETYVLVFSVNSTPSPSSGLWLLPIASFVSLGSFRSFFGKLAVAADLYLSAVRGPWPFEGCD
jgi:hypothetical protein